MDSELIRGVIKQRMAAQYLHEWIFMWLSSLLTNFVEYQKLGRILGSRTAVKINEYDGRLPDILFV
ncbi:MAG: Uma2 family endonuclease [Armatimonadetes bacterium]|nr:Uma2 family endonuclease [Armatimonadota bacterium]